MSPIASSKSFMVSIARHNDRIKVPKLLTNPILIDNVISRIPFTKWKNMAAVFSSDHVDETLSKDYKLSVELRVSFMYPSIKE